MRIDIIHNKDCSNMEDVAGESIDLIISGPPYWDYVDYESYVRNDKEYLWIKDNPYQGFLEQLEVWNRECLRVLRPGRYCILNLGTVRKDNKTYALPFHAVALMEQLGFTFEFEIVWHKVSGGRMHARNVIQAPYPGYYRPNNRTEYLLVFRKDPAAPFADSKGKQRAHQNRIEIDDYFKREVANNVWHIMPSCFPLNGNHPCPFPPEIPYRLIKLFSLTGDIVLDPFMGIGTTARASKALGRHFIGYELQQKFIDIALEEMKKPLHFRKPIDWVYKK